MSDLVKFACAVFVFLFGTFSLFSQAAHNPNIVSRLALTTAVVQNGSIVINGYEDMTFDKAFRDGKYYTDKAPMLSFLAIPAAAAFNAIAPVTWGDASSKRFWAYAWFCTVFSVGLISAAAGAALSLTVLSKTKSYPAAVLSACVYGLATPMLGWSTAFFGHAPAAAMVLLAWVLLDCAEGRARRAVGGALLGLAVSLEYTAVVPAAVIGAILFARLWIAQGFQRAVLDYAIATFAGLAVVSPILVYNQVAFGGPFSLGYAHLQAFEEMQRGLFGITTPKPWIAWELLFGRMRGLLWCAPAFFALALGVWYAWRSETYRHLALASVLIFAWYLLSNAGYAYWNGGYSTGPRHMTGMFGMLCLCFGLVWPQMPQPARQVSYLLFGIGAVISIAAAAVDMAAPDHIADPIFTYILPKFFAGQLQTTVFYWFFEFAGLLNLLPLAALGAALAWYVRRLPSFTRHIAAAPVLAH